MTGSALLRSLPAAIALLVSTAGAATFQAGQPVMGTILQVTVVSDSETQSRKLAEAAIEEARKWDDVLTTWRPEGELARLNAAAGKGRQKISPELRKALAKMIDQSLATGGAFDPGVGPLVNLWRTTNLPAIPRPGPRFHILTALKLFDTEASLAKGAALDAGGNGKGIALDEIAKRLRKSGASAMFLDFGGSSQLALGLPTASGDSAAPGTRMATSDAWRVALTGLAPGKIHGTLVLNDMSLSTSKALPPGDAAGPIVDPRSGHIAPAPRLATVLARSAALADAWSTALVVLGRPGIEKARTAQLEVLFEDDAGVVITDGLRAKLEAPPLPDRH